MSSFSVDEIGIDEVTQKVHEQQLAIRFDHPRRQDEPPQIGVVILRLLGFGIVMLIGINPDEV
jgi:hypothetical protein